MPVNIIGSFTSSGLFSKQRQARMANAIVKESQDKIQELVKKRTPRGATGKLRRSIKKSKVRRTSLITWEGSVYSNLEYAAAIEYGMSPQVIEPTRRDALKFYWGETGRTEFFSSVNWPGYEGRHMFQLAREEFERRHADDIAKNNMRQWLGTVDAGRRVITI
jgi:hypothetical protein